MATLEKPTNNKAKGKGLPPQEIEASTNLHKLPPGELKALNFKVEEDFHNAFKTLSVHKRMSMVDLLKDMYDRYDKL